MRQSCFQLLVVLLLSTVIICDAEAGTGGRRKGVVTSQVFTTGWVLAANVGITINTESLSPSTTDTIINVQNSASGVFLAGNDDFVGLASQVTLPPQSTSRSIRIIVHTYSNATRGSAVLRISPTNATSTTMTINVGGDVFTVPNGLEALSHVFTAPEKGGTNDTVVLITCGYSINGHAFDDDTGVGNMSWLHLDTACPSSALARIVTGTYYAQGGKTTVIFDEDVHDPQGDNDGLSDPLEVAIGTDPTKADTDGDGLADGAEVMGIDGSSTDRVPLPLFGADPLVKDLFLEADWVKCTEELPGCDNGNPNFYQVTPAIALKLRDFYAPDITLHIDTGIANTDPATWFAYDALGGARQIPTNTGQCGDQKTGWSGRFHSFIIEGLGGGQAHTPGHCGWAGRHARALAHELGHNLGLGHGGSPAAGDMNCKPHWRSPPNYVYASDDTVTSYSRNTFAGVVLNPLSLDESVGLGTGTYSNISFLQDSRFNLFIDAYGGVDWNRDAVISPSGTLVRGAPTWNWGTGGCDQSGARMEALSGDSSNVVDPVLARLDSRMYVFGRNAVTGTLTKRFTTSDLTLCSGAAAGSCAAWTPPPGSTSAIVPNSVAIQFAPAALRYFHIPSSLNRLLVVYVTANGLLQYQTLTLNGSTEFWTSPGLVNSGLQTITGDPALIFRNGQMHLYAPSAGRLKHWTYDPSSDTWSITPTDEQWSDATYLGPKFGVALTSGYQDGIAGQQVFMAMAQAPTGTVELARYDGATSKWVKLANSIWWTTPWNTPENPVATARPGLAYLPLDPSGNITNGRFYLAWNAGPSLFFITHTRGNVLSNPLTITTQRGFRFLPPVYFFNQWQEASGGTGLLWEEGHDNSLRATWHAVSNSVMFAPLADGIFNIELKDQDDYPFISARLSCSLLGGCP